MNLTFVFNYLLSDGVLTEKTYPYKPGKDKCDRLANDTKNVVYLDYFIKVIDEIHLKATLGKFTLKYHYRFDHKLNNDLWSRIRNRTQNNST